MHKFHIKKGDSVFVNSGSYQGKQGKVLGVVIKDERAIVEGINLVKKHTKPDAENTKGGIIEKEMPIHISNLNLIDPHTKKPTRVGKRLNKNNKLVRFAKKSGEDLE